MANHLTTLPHKGQMFRLMSLLNLLSCSMPLVFNFWWDADQAKGLTLQEATNFHTEWTGNKGETSARPNEEEMYGKTNRYWEGHWQVNQPAFSHSPRLYSLVTYESLEFPLFLTMAFALIGIWISIKISGMEIFLCWTDQLLSFCIFIDKRRVIDLGPYQKEISSLLTLSLRTL